MHSLHTADLEIILQSTTGLNMPALQQRLIDFFYYATRTNQPASSLYTKETSDEQIQGLSKESKELH